MKAATLIDPESLLRRLAQGEAKIIDVRAPVEFAAGSIPGSINLPILNDIERAQVGTVYKQEGSTQAIALGHKLVSGETKAARVDEWAEFVRRNPGTSVITCFRGGMRSQLAQSWLGEKDIPIPRLAGGYKKLRQVLMEEIVRFSRSKKLLVLSGKTGAGKTDFLKQIKDFPTVDLEALAKHRGSAFGGLREAQPSQIDFENLLAVQLAKLHSATTVLVEDESRLIGKSVQPESFFNLLRGSPVLVLDEPLETRVENTYQEYVVARASEGSLFPGLQDSLYKIKNRLGGLRYSEVSQDVRRAQMTFRESKDLTPSRLWIEKLLVWYYDPLYEQSWKKRKPEVLASSGRAGVLEILRSERYS